MGYRSDVRIITSTKGYEKLQEFVKNYLAEHKEEDNLLEECDVKLIGKNQCYLGWDSIKWYEYDFAEVDAIMEGIRNLGENEYSYRYMRIGEEYDDYEEEYYDGEKEKGLDVEYPSLIREFDDSYVMDLIKDLQVESPENNKEEMDL